MLGMEEWANEFEKGRRDYGNAKGGRKEVRKGASGI